MNDDDINRVELRGRLTQNPVLRNLADGRAVANGGMATNRWASAADGERKERTEFHNLVAWQGHAKELARLVKGDAIHVRGRLQTRVWEGQDGQKRRTTEVVVEDFVPTRAPAASPALDEEVPFQ